MAKRYGQWEVLESAGEGGQGHIFKVTRSGDPKTYALKRLKNSKRLPRFRAEVEAMNKVTHPRIVPIVDHDLEGATPYYVMPFYARGCLTEEVRTARSPAELLTLFEQVLAGVSILHQNNITHRDLKPENILLDDQGTAVVADFGLCFFDGNGVETLSNEAVGPRHYTAPELEAGHVLEVKPTADVYSLGKVLYWILTGAHLPRERYAEAAYQLSRRLGETRFDQWNRFFKVSLSEDPGKRLDTASVALDACRAIRKDWDATINLPSPTHRQRCVFCGVGTYAWFAPDSGASDGASNWTGLRNRFGLEAVGGARIRMMRCNRCRNLQWFDVAEQQGDGTPNPWAKET